MGIISWIVFGVVAGFIAKSVMPGPTAGGIMVAIPVGVLGALIGGSLGTVFGGNASIGFDVLSLFAAISGSLFSLLCFRSYALRTGA